MYDKLRENLREKFEYYEDDIRDEDAMDLSEYDLREAIQRNESFKLFRYMPLTYHSIRNFEKQTIHLSQNGVMNDVYEGVPGAHDVELPYSKLQKLRDLASMTCFTETNNNTLMWSHYANSHEGFCVEYDLKLLGEDPFGILDHLFPVIYMKNRPIVRDVDSLIKSHADLNEAIDKQYEYDGDEMLDDILPLVLTKGMEWAYEKEWRVVYTKKQMYDIDDEILYAGNLHFPCVTGVYLGYRINPDIKENLIEIAERLSTAEKRNIHVYQAKLEETGYGILFDEIV